MDENRERRRDDHSVAQLLDAINNVAHALDGHISRSEESRTRMDGKINGLHETLTDFRAKHEPTLIQIAALEARKKNIKEAVIDKLATGAIYAAIAAFFTAAWVGAKSYFGIAK